MNISQALKAFFKFFIINPLPGRINGWKYLVEELKMTLIGLIAPFVIIILLLIFSSVASPKVLTEIFAHGNYSAILGSTVFIVFFTLVFIVSIMFVMNIFYIKTKRLHDLNASGWWSLLSFIPFVNLILYLLLCFCPGSKKVNKYGERPAKPTTGQMIIAVISFVFLFLPLFFFSGVFQK